MAQPPANPILPFDLVRNIPPISQKTFNFDGVNHALLANGATMVAAFDCGLAVTDPAQFLTPATLPSADPTPSIVGKLLDALWTSSGVGRVDIDFAVDYTCPYDTIISVGVVATVTDHIAALRITGRFVRLTFTNTSGAPTNTRFGVYLGTN